MIFLLRVLLLVAQPIRFLGQVVFVLLLTNLYRLYFQLKKHLVGLWRPAKNKLLFPLSTRYVLHGILIGATVLVATNSLKAREVRQEELMKPTILSSLLTSDGEEEIVETAFFAANDEGYFRGTGGISPLDFAEPSSFESVVATQESSSLIKPQLATTTVGERTRETIVKHIVAGGETVSTIAEQYGVSTNTILWENKLSERDLIQPDQQLTILPVTGVSHQVHAGETVAAIAKKYQANEPDIVAFNKLASAEAIAADQILLIPNGVVPPPPPQPTTRLARTLFEDENFSGAIPPDASSQGGSKLLWPTPSHRINTYFTYRHRGLDIEGNYQSPIYAAEDGRVESVGWGGGYGLHVVINHGNGMKTLYAHDSKVFVKTGDQVNRGQTIAMQGCTGWCTGVHVHFEVFLGGKKANPLSYL